MRFAAAQGNQPAHAAHVGGHQAQIAGSFSQKLGQNVEGQIVAADGYNRALYFMRRAVKMNSDLIPGVLPFAEARNAQDAVGAHERGDDAGAAADGRDHDLLAYFAD